jgi:hypothetical protein
MSIGLFIVAVISFFVFWFLITAWREATRVEFIKTYNFPKGLYDKLRQKHPDIGPKEFQLVNFALKQFFLAHLKSGKKYVSMPSQIVDDLWHEFILYTRGYEKFCGTAFGRFMHHTPAVVLQPSKKASSKIDNEGLRRVWWYCCKEESIDPKQSTRLPLLFAIDKKLGIKNGFVYSLDCKRILDSGSTAGGGCGGGASHCTADFSDSSIDGGTAGFGDSGSSDGGGGDSGSSDGGSGCGGGGCGGGGD